MRPSALAPLPSLRCVGASQGVGPHGEHVAGRLVARDRRPPLRFGSDPAACAARYRVSAAEPHAHEWVLLKPGIGHRFSFVTAVPRRFGCLEKLVLVIPSAAGNFSEADKRSSIRNWPPVIGLRALAT